MNSYYWSDVFRNLAEIWSIPEALTTSKFFKVFSNDVICTLCKTNSSYLLRICLSYSLVVLIPNLFFGGGRFSSNESAKFEKNRQKVFAFFFRSKETAPFFFNDILDVSPLQKTYLKISKFVRVLWDCSYFRHFFPQSKVFSY